MQWRIEPATKDELKTVEGRSGYRVHVTLPPDMPDGRFSEFVEFSAMPAGSPAGPRSVQMHIEGSIDGRLTFFGGRVSSDHVLRLGVLHENDHVQESLLMKVNDERPGLAVEHIETVPDFLRVRVACGSDPAKKGLYRLAVEFSMPPRAILPSGALRRFV